MPIPLGRIRCFGFHFYLSNLSYFKKILKLGTSNRLFSVIFSFSSPPYFASKYQEKEIKGFPYFLAISYQTVPLFQAGLGQGLSLSVLPYKKADPAFWGSA